MKPLLLFTLAAVLATSRSMGTAQEMMSGEKSPSSLAAVPAPVAKTLSRADEILQRFDKNGDGRLDDDEKADAHEVMLQERMAKELPPAELQGLGYFQSLAVELFDRNHDGRIDESERSDATIFLERGDLMVTQETLTARFDRNRDGKLDDPERREAQAYAIEHQGEFMREVLLKRFDGNGNGQLEAEEKTAVRAAFMAMPTPQSLPAGEERDSRQTTVPPKGLE
jgi:Ca2+-binding EF-hand superfamily protein